MKTTVTLSISELESLIKKAKEGCDDVYVSIVEIEVIQPSKCYMDSDRIDARLLSGYAECNSKWIYSNRK